MSRFLLTPIAVLALALPLAACGDDDGAESADVDRYCEITRELDQVGEEAFAALEGDEDATAEDFEQAERELVENNEDLLDEAVEVAPEEIRDDVEVLVSGLRQRAGLSEEEVSTEELNEAEAAVSDFEDENCPDEGGAVTEETTTTDTDETTTTETETEPETDETTTTEDETTTEETTTEETTEDSGGVSPE